MNTKKAPDMSVLQGQQNPFIKYLSTSPVYNEATEYNSIVYFITDGTFTKIGVTTDVDKRLKQLQTGNPNKLSVLLIIEGDYTIESLLHSHFYNYKKSGEWFEIPMEMINTKTIIDILKGISKIEGLDNTQFTKVYCSPENRKIRNAFSLRAKEMYLWLLDEIEYGKDYIWINKDRYMKEMNISSMNTYKDALNELIRYGHLTETITKGVYWINPEFFFKGNRVTKYPKKVRVQYSNEQEYEHYIANVNE
jgi:hypothetical protein